MKLDFVLKVFDDLKQKKKLKFAVLTFASLTLVMIVILGIATVWGSSFLYRQVSTAINTPLVSDVKETISRAPANGKAIVHERLQQPLISMECKDSLVSLLNLGELFTHPIAKKWDGVEMACLSPLKPHEQNLNVERNI
ncbi:MAG: hypothetical protein R3A80_07060 [Bdellovibrionota bacterium]